MDDAKQIFDGRKLLRDGWPDEDVERFTGLSLRRIVLLRMEATAAAANAFPPPARAANKGR